MESALLNIRDGQPSHGTTLHTTCHTSHVTCICCDEIKNKFTFYNNLFRFRDLNYTVLDLLMKFIIKYSSLTSSKECLLFEYRISKHKMPLKCQTCSNIKYVLSSATRFTLISLCVIRCFD